jgi:hypothetical protein
MSWLRLDSQMVICRPYFALGGGFVIVVAVAIALAVALRPAPLTGDVAADAACAAMASAAIKDGQLSPAMFATLTDAERDETIRTAKEHAKQSTIHDIRAAGQALGATNLTSEPFGRQPVGESVSDPGRLVRDQFGSRSRVRTARWSLPGMSCTVKVSALMPSVASTWSI